GASVDAEWAAFAQGLFYQQVDDADADAYTTLGRRVDAIAADRGLGSDRVFYLAIPPSAYAGVIQRLGAAGLVPGDGTASPWTRIIIEKPFGRDLASARALNATVGAVFHEDQVYRIDHYLGKETVQNILALRFANGVFEPVWNRRYVDHVQITVAE